MLYKALSIHDAQNKPSKMSQIWRPWRSNAVFHLWRHSSEVQSARKGARK
jgi:3-methyladenine DNA glycosylase/8-oxoguanine DNA glycosylase